MPDYFTHIIAAEKIYGALNEKYRRIIAENRTLYLLGAQGGDIFFFYGLNYRHNAGRMLHRENAFELFEKLKDGDPAYCAGWATHYALDCTVHPFVYAWEEKHSGLFMHQRYERDLGLYVSRKCGVRRTILPRERILECTFAICDSIKKVLPYVTAAGVAGCLKRHFIYTRRVFRAKKQEYSLNCDYSQAYLAFERGCQLGVKAVESVLDKNIDPQIFDKSFLQK